MFEAPSDSQDALFIQEWAQFRERAAVCDNAVGTDGGYLVSVVKRLHYAEPTIPCFVELGRLKN